MKNSPHSSLVNSGRALSACAHPLATEAGRDVLAAGGNAIEAAIAAGMVLCVCYPHMTGLGGDAFLLMADADGRVDTVSGIGQAAAAMQPGAAVPMRGPGSAATAAAAVDAFGVAYEYSRREWSGKLAWRDLVAPAMRLARTGSPVSKSHHAWHTIHREQLLPQPGFAAVFEPEGKVPQPGDLLRQPALADTLADLAQNGARAFYDGALAASIAADLAAAGSPLRKQDLAGCRARVEAPLTLTYGDSELLTLQPPTQGVTTLELLGIVQAYGLGALEEGGADYYHLLVEAAKLAFIDRNRLLGGAVQAGELTQLLEPAYLKRQAANIRPGQAAPWPPALPPADTAWSGFVDHAGRAVSLLQSIFMDFGSGVVLPQSGVLWHNRAFAFRVDPNHPNAAAPGKRPMHTLNPFMVRKDGRVRYVLGTQGGDGQVQTLAVLLTRLLDYGLDPLQALARPRFLLGRSFEDTAESLKVESDAGAAVIAALRERGHTVDPVSPQHRMMGHAGIIELMPDGVRGAHDPRGEGSAAEA